MSHSTNGNRTCVRSSWLMPLPTASTSAIIFFSSLPTSASQYTEYSIQWSCTQHTTLRLLCARTTRKHHSVDCAQHTAAVRVGWRCMCRPRTLSRTSVSVQPFRKTLSCEWSERCAVKALALWSETLNRAAEAIHRLICVRPIPVTVVLVRVMLKGLKERCDAMACY